MIADTSEELKKMAVKIGVNLKWIQCEGTYREHFDVCLSKKELAVKFGATLISRSELGELLLNRKK
jgi:hypothetical protein